MLVKPVIGITAVPRDVPTGYGGDIADTITHATVRAVANAGGVPLMLPVVEPFLAAAQARPLDGLVLAGGQDLAGEGSLEGRWVHPPRDHHELALWRDANTRGIPVLGVCRGLQLVNVALGGDLLEHVEGHDAGTEHAARPHPVEVAQPSRLVTIVGDGPVDVNTIHHQALGELGRGLRPSAWSSDGVVEAAELFRPWFVGVQWHPELMLDSPAGQSLFDALVRQAGRRPATPEHAPVA